MENNFSSHLAIRPVSWYSEEFIYESVLHFLKENGYKVHRDNFEKEAKRTGRIITASKFFKKEVIEVKGFPFHSVSRDTLPAKSTHVIGWFTEALFNSFVNFGISDNAEVAMALPNVGRYQAIIKKLEDYFSINDLYFRIYLVNEDGSVDVSNLNSKYARETL